jgi:hypothetical protein
VARANHYTREAWLAAPEEHRDELMAEDALVCPSCGNLRSVCSRPDSLWYPQRSMCYATAAKTLAWRQMREKHKNNEPDAASLHPTDGLEVWVADADLTPDDTFV